ncbi:YgaP family membrane protein [Neptuniibacter halophilus]|uniref:YgaP family membrane protein n=1 Tax=Neptuniibacter halophilus TaxID=651666 RepID=UPI00257377F9|nr:DUF2892 domain-containing protein [Neptuniibacter halophilus]
MQCNVGKTDRIIRIIIGLCIMLAGYLYGSWLGLIGLIPLGTALIGWCPAYLPFGFSSCKKPD